MPGTDPIDAQTQEFISSEIIYSILEGTSAVYGSGKEGIFEPLEDNIGAFRAKL